MKVWEVAQRVPSLVVVCCQEKDLNSEKVVLFIMTFSVCLAEVLCLVPRADRWLNPDCFRHLVLSDPWKYLYFLICYLAEAVNLLVDWVSLPDSGCGFGGFFRICLIVHVEVNRCEFCILTIFTQILGSE
jgi:hypothetical protein